MADLLALYGTLMSGLRPRPGAPPLQDHIELVGECVLEGVLYDMGPYPGLLDGRGRVRGELWRCLSSEALGVLDRWEDYYPDSPRQSMYVRRRVMALEPECEAWVYYWNRSIAEQCLISCGDWREHLAGRRGLQFT